MSKSSIYTKKGDSGETNLASGECVLKNSLRVETYGSIDELSCFVGLAIVTARKLTSIHPNLSELTTILVQVQHELFNLASLLATNPDKIHEKQPKITEANVTRLEKYIDKMDAVLPALHSFILAGASELSAQLHVCRTICRRAERLCVSLLQEDKIDKDLLKYLNRLSDAFFVWSRWADFTQGVKDTLWDPKNL